MEHLIPIALLAVVGYGIYYFYNKKKNTSGGGANTLPPKDKYPQDPQ